MFQLKPEEFPWKVRGGFVLNQTVIKFFKPEVDTPSGWYVGTVTTEPTHGGKWASVTFSRKMPNGCMLPEMCEVSADTCYAKIRLVSFDRKKSPKNAP